MNIIAVDDKKPVLLQVEDAIRKAAPSCRLAGFTSAQDALAYAKSTQIDVAFLDIDMAGMNGLVLAKRLKDIYGKTNIVFVTGFSEYALDAFAVPASGYILKPAQPERIAFEIGRLRDPVAPGPTGRVRIKCFGSFSVFVDGQPLTFTRSKAKELLALLVHKCGDEVSNAEIASVLWEDKPYGSTLQSYTRSVRSQLMAVLKQAGAENIIRKSHNRISIDTEKISCDYHEALNGNVDALNTYMGEYMSEYSWAEFTAAYLDRRTK